MLTWRRAVCTGQQTNLFLYLASAIPVCNGQAASSSPTLHWADRNYHLFLTITTPALHSPQPWLESSGKLQISTSSCASDESCRGGFTVELRHQVDPVRRLRRMLARRECVEPMTSAVVDTAGALSGCLAG
eukprot:2518383-Pleurochrysis_carterae.AAC.2